MKAGIQVFCPRCKQEGLSEKVKKGSGGLEVFLWIIGFVALWIVPLIYSIWRRSGIVPSCRFCGETGIVPLWTRKEAVAKPDSPA